MTKAKTICERDGDIKLAKMEKDIEYIKIGIDRNKADTDSKLDTIITNQKLIDTKLQNHINEEEEMMNKKYASKWTEDAMKLTIGTICTMVIVAIMYVILK